MSDARSAAAFALAASVAWVGLGSCPLVEPSDARYAEIAREMWISGDYLLPRFLGLLHLHKSPLMYWLSAAGYQVFGLSPWGARAGLGVLSAALGFVLWRFARRHLGAGPAPWAVAVAATTPALMAAGRLLSTDLLLAFLLTVALTGWYDIRSGRKGLLPRISLYGGAGLAFFCKGPVAWLLLALVIVAFALLNRNSDGHVQRNWGSVWGIPLALALGLTWYVYVASRTPGLASYFLEGQVASRLREGGMGHTRPWFYFVGVFPALGLPWIFLAAAGWRALRREDLPLARFLACWGLAPPLFFSLPATKLPLYPLPAYPALALLAAALLGARNRTAPLPLRLAAGTLGAAGLAAFAVATGRVPLGGGDLTPLWGPERGTLLLPIAAVLLVGAGLSLWNARTRARFAAGTVAAALAFVPLWASTHGDMLPLRSARAVGLAAAREVRAGDVFGEFRKLSGGVPFYSGRLPVTAGISRETLFDDPLTVSESAFGEERFLSLWFGPKRVVVVTGEASARTLPAARELARGGGYVLVENRAPFEAADPAAGRTTPASVP